jgi:hypothetical protein
MEESRYSSTTLDLGSEYRWAVSFTPRPFYPREERPRHPLDRGLGGEPAWTASRREKYLAPAENRIRLTWLKRCGTPPHLGAATLWLCCDREACNFVTDYFINTGHQITVNILITSPVSKWCKNCSLILDDDEPKILRRMRVAPEQSTENRMTS